MIETRGAQPPPPLRERTKLGSLMSNASKPLGNVTRRYRRASLSGLCMLSVTFMSLGMPSVARALEWAREVTSDRKRVNLFSVP